LKYIRFLIKWFYNLPVVYFKFTFQKQL
jgi:hypothetical protein